MIEQISDIATTGRSSSGPDFTNLSPLTDLSTIICSKLSPLFSVDFTNKLRLSNSLN